MKTGTSDTTSVPVPPALEPAPQLPPPPPPPIRRTSRLPLYGGILAVVVVVLLLLVFLHPGFFGLAPAGSSGASGEMMFSQARPVGNAAVAGYAGGGWALVFATGVDTPTSVVVPFNLTNSLSSNCTFTPGPGGPSTLSVPAFRGNLSGGVAPAWMLAYRNGSGAVAVVVVEGGHGSIFGILSGGVCESFFALLAAVPTNVIDSSQAAAAVEADASPFLSAHANASALFALLGGFSFLGLGTGPTWSVQYSTCAIGPNATGTGAQFNATVNGLTGKVVYAQTTPAVTCATNTTSTTPLGSALAVGSETFSSNGVVWDYNATVVSASSGIAWDAILPSVTNSSGGTTVSTGWSLNALGPSGSVIATFGPATGSWTGSASQPIAAGDALSLTADANLNGDLLTLAGTGTYSGSLVLFL